MNARKILVLGASGLIGRFVTDDLRAAGLSGDRRSRGISHRRKRSAPSISSCPIMSMDAGSLARLLREREIDVVVNCLGVLQDGPGSDTARRAPRFRRDACWRRSATAAARCASSHISIPGTANEDRTAFSTTKREAERLIAASGIALRDPAAGLCGGAVRLWRQRHAAGAGGVSAAIAGDESATPFQPVAVEDIAATIAWLAGRDIDDAAARAVTWDLMQPQPITLGNVIEQFRWSFGTSGWPRITLPALPARSRRRGRRSRQPCSAGCRRCARPRSPNCAAASPAIPRPGWRRPASCRSRWRRWSARHAATIQDKWFARLFLVKALVIASLAVFWIVSGFISLVVSYPAAADILTIARFSGLRWSHR